jgi:CubicO group peptidase (beta-lactamase class C family)
VTRWKLIAGLFSITLSLAADPAYFPPPDSAGGWRTDPAKGAARKRFDEIFDYIQTSSRNGGLLVVYKGRLIYERYFGRGHREATPNMASCGKPVTSIALGILIDQRRDLFPEGLDQKIYTTRYLPAEAFPLNDPRKADIRLGQLLTMTAGLRGNNPGRQDGRAVTFDPPGPDGWPALKNSNVFGVGLWCDPGAGYSYATASIHLGSIILRHVAGMELEEYVRRHIAKPLGWSRWGYGYRNRDLEHTPGGGGIALRAADSLRFLYMLLRNGRWGDQQIVPADYIRLCGRRSPYNRHSPYSLQFDVNEDGHVSGVPKDAFWKSGSGGHAYYVIPSLDLIAVKLGGRDGQYDREDTGLPEAPRSAENRYFKEGKWTASVEPDTAVIETLRRLVAVVRAQR